LVRELELVIDCELEQTRRVARERHRPVAERAHDAAVVEHRVEAQVWQEDFQERRWTGRPPLARRARQRAHCALERAIPLGNEARVKRAAVEREVVDDLLVRQRICAGAQVIDAVLNARSLVQLYDRSTDVIRRHDVEPPVGIERQHRQAREQRKCAHHIELRRLGEAAITEHDARAEHDRRHVRQELVQHVLGELLRARVRVVVAAIPIDRRVFLHRLTRTHPRDRGRRHVAEAQ